MIWTILPICCVCVAIWSCEATTEDAEVHFLKMRQDFSSCPPRSLWWIVKLLARTHSWLFLQRFGSRHDLDDFARNGRLPDLVHVQREVRDHVGGVLRRRIHRRHLRGKERRVRLEQRAIHL